MVFPFFPHMFRHVQTLGHGVLYKSLGYLKMDPFCRLKVLTQNYPNESTVLVFALYYSHKSQVSETMMIPSNIDHSYTYGSISELIARKQGQQDFYFSANTIIFSLILWCVSLFVQRAYLKFKDVKKDLDRWRKATLLNFGWSLEIRTGQHRSENCRCSHNARGCPN